MPYKDPAKKRAADAAYRATHREEIRAYITAWHVAHPEKERIYQAAYAATHRAKLRARATAYYQAHRAEAAAYHEAHRAKRRAKSAAYSAAHPDEKRARSAARRARKCLAPINDLTAAQWKAMKEHFKHCCAYCGRKAQRLTQDHITPLPKGGSHTLSNIVPACRSCNSIKHTGPPLSPVQPMLLSIAAARDRKP